MRRLVNRAVKDLAGAILTPSFFYCEQKAYAKLNVEFPYRPVMNRCAPSLQKHVERMFFYRKDLPKSESCKNDRVAARPKDG